MAKSLSGEINDVESLVKSMVDEGIDLCVGGEESWLAMGLADKARQAGITQELSEIVGGAAAV